MDLSKILEDSKVFPLPSMRLHCSPEIMEPTGDTGHTTAPSHEMTIHDQEGSGSVHPHQDEKPGSAAPTSSHKRELEEEAADQPKVENKRSKKTSNKSDLPMDSSLFDDAVIGQSHEAPVEFDADASRDRVLQAIIDEMPPEDLAQARRDRADFVKRCRTIGRASVKPVDGGMWSVPGMKTPLLSYQVIAVGRGLGLEKQGSGVLLADQMGLGKTLETLGVITASRPAPSVKARATLVICQPNNYEQWRAEIRNHCICLDEPHKAGNGIGNCVFWRHKNASNNVFNAMHALATADIILTTTSEVIDSYNETKGSAKGQGALHKTNFFRVCLDEAHVIRNESCAISKACRTLNAQRHWAMTGTPLLNSSSDLWAVMDFLKHPLAKNKQSFYSEATDVAKLLNGPLAKCTIRRTYATKLFGKKLVDLPPMTRKDIPVTLTTLEAKVYKVVHARLAVWAEEIMDDDEVKNKTTRLMGLLLRPRQLVSHPMMLQNVICYLLKEQDIEELYQMLDQNEYEGLQDKTLARLLSKSLKVSWSQKVAIQQAAAMQTSDDQPKPKHEHEPDCTQCKKAAEDAQITSCSHIYCRSCLTVMQQTALELELAPSSFCMACGQLIEGYEDYSSDTRENNVRKSESGCLNQVPIFSIEKHNDKHEGRIEDWLDESGKIYRSSKMIELIRVTTDFMASEKEGKIIWFTQWLGFGRVLARVCEEEGWKYAKYDGSITLKAKDKALEEFNDPKNKKRVLIASLKAGGVGLNLTIASKVVMLDHWWNTAIEQQAFARVYRIGQKSETEMITFVVKDTVEEHLVKVKARKDGETTSIITALEDIWRS